MRHGQWMIRTVTAGLLGLILVAAGVGCSRMDRDGNGNVNGVKSQSYADDGYLGRTNTYAGIPGRRMTDTYATDDRFMQKTLAGVPGVAGANIMFNGGEAYVSLKLDPGITGNQRQTVESQATTALRFNFPKYDFHVSTIP